MTPEFLLHLSADGIALDRRIDGDTPGWHRLGVVPLDSSNLTSDLADLRGKAGPDKSPATEVYVVLPMDQIKTMSVRALAMSRGDVAEALEGQTPYPVSQLRFDWRRHDAGSLIAAVAQDTLEEATAFAQQHQFEAVAFVALPGDDWGLDFAFFGGADVANDSSAPLKLPFVMLSDADIAPPVVAAEPEPEPEP
ncbi:MAG: hypothetical protein ACPGRD_10670, partial [Planktomarina sp.]